MNLALFALLLAIAAYNRYALTARLLAGVAASGRVLASFAGMEIGLVLAIVAIAGLWRFEPPGMSRAIAVLPIAAEIGTPELWAAITISAAPENGAVPAIAQQAR